jgi:hypothetical protein
MKTPRKASVLAKIQVKPGNTCPKMVAAAGFLIINDFVIVTKV